MKTIQFNQAAKTNPFYGMVATLALASEASKLRANVPREAVKQMLAKAYAEAKTDEQKALYYSIVFSLGDIGNRSHNLFRRNKIKAEGGGNSAREVFRIALDWMLSYSKETREQFYRFMPIIGEYTNVENLFYNRIKTDRNKGKVTSVERLPIDNRRVAEYIASVLQSPSTQDVEKQIWAKYLVAPSYRDRVRKKVKKTGDVVRTKKERQKETLGRYKAIEEFNLILSELMGWEVVQYPNNKRFVGLEAFKQTYNQRSEAVLFSTKRVLKMDSYQFQNWLDGLPSTARFRVQCRLFDKDKKTGKLVKNTKWVGEYGNLADFYDTWVASKKVANDELRKLEQVAPEQRTITQEKQIKELKKAAKVNTGAETVSDLLVKFLDVYTGSKNRTELEVIAENILRKIKLEVPVFWMIDDSGSMTNGGWHSLNVGGRSITPMDVAALALTTFMYKAATPELADVFAVFSDRAQVVYDEVSELVEKKNRYTVGTLKATGVKLIDRSKPFIDVFEQTRNWLFTHFQGGSTDVSELARVLKQWVDAATSTAEKDIRREAICKFPVWGIISDGNFNNQNSASDSLVDFKHKMLQWFGWDGILVVWDVQSFDFTGTAITRFKNIENVIHFNSANPQVLNQIFTNLDDLDVVDIYTPLVSMYRSNRYLPVRQLVGKAKPIEELMLVTSDEVA